MFRPIRRLIGAGTLALLTAVALVLARFLPEFWFRFYTDFSRGAMRAIAAVTGLFPFCLWQLALVVLIVWVLVRLILAIKHKRVLGWAAGLLELLCLGALLFVGLWGLNHYAPSIGEQTGLEVRAYSKDELKAAAEYYAQKASEYSTQVPRDAEGRLQFPAFSELSELAVQSYERLGATNERFSGCAPRVKPLLVSKAFAYMGTTGIYVCLTGESSVSTECFILSQPFTMCHELGHSLAVAGEDEANYCAFLACRESESPIFLYSGYYSAFIYCHNALYRQDKSAANALWALCSDELVFDSDVHVEHNKQYEGKVQDAAQAVNDAYLKAFQEEGVRSYGLVVDYLIAEYLNN